MPETVLRFELAALREVGHCPRSTSAWSAAGQVDDRATSEWPFGMTAGGVLCDECRPGRRGVVSVSGGVIAALRRAMSEQTAEMTARLRSIQRSAASCGR